jgi:hypothetical protein
LTEAFAKLNQVPLAFPGDNDPDNENFFYISIITGTYFINYLLFKIKND